MASARDSRFIARFCSLTTPIFRRLYGCQVSGMEELGEGPYLLIANHNVGAIIEILTLLEAWEIRYEGRTPIHGLAHSFAFRIPGLSALIGKFGGVPATYESAFQVLESGHSLAIFPGGTYETVRPFSQRGSTDMGGHKGWARIALARNVSVVPVSISGSHGVNPIFFRSRWLASALILPRILGVNWLPLSVSQVLYTSGAYFALRGSLPLVALLPLCYLIFLFSILWPSWPSRIRMRVGKPFDLGAFAASAGDEPTKLDACYREVSRRIQLGMDALIL